MRAYHSICFLLALIGSAYFLIRGVDTKAIYFLIMAVWLCSYEVEDDEGDNDKE